MHRRGLINIYTWLLKKHESKTSWIKYHFWASLYRLNSGIHCTPRLSLATTTRPKNPLYVFYIGAVLGAILCGFLNYILDRVWWSVVCVCAQDTLRSMLWLSGFGRMDIRIGILLFDIYEISRYSWKKLAAVGHCLQVVYW